MCVNVCDFYNVLAAVFCKNVSVECDVFYFIEKEQILTGSVVYELAVCDICVFAFHEFHQMRVQAVFNES